MSTKGFTVRLGARVDQYVAAMKAAEKATTNFSAQTSRNMQKVGATMQQVGGSMTTRVTLPLVAITTAAGKMGYDFDQAFGRMVGLANVAGSAVEGLKDDVLQLSKETAVAPQELADALYFAASAGLDTAGAMDALTASAKASAAGLGNTQDVVGLVASAVASYGADVISAAEATDILTATVRAGRADPAELAGSLGRILPIASQLGVEFDEVGGATAYLSNVFGDTGRTVTAMSGFLAKLVAPTQQGRKALTEMGTSVEELQSVLRNDGLIGALELLRTKGFAGNQQALRALFDDIEGYQGALALLNDANGKLVPTMNEVADSAGATGEAYDAVASTDSYKLKEALNELRVILTEVGGDVLPMAADAARFVATAIGEVVEVVSGLPEPLQKVVLGFLAFAAVTGPMLSVGGSIVRNLESMRAGATLVQGALAKMGVSAAATTATLGVLGAVVAGAAVAYVAYRAFTAEERKVAARAKEVAAGLSEATAAAITNAGATDTARIAHVALSNALSTTGEDGARLTEALGTLGLTTADALDTLVGLEKDPIAALKALAMQAGATGDEAEKLAAKIAASDEPFWGVSEANAWLTDDLKATGRAMEELQDQQENLDLDAMVRGFLTSDAASSDLRQELLTQAEAMSGVKRTGTDLLPLYEAYTQLLAENKSALEGGTGATQTAADVMDEYAGATESANVSAADLLDVMKEQTSEFEQAASAANIFRDALDAVFGAPRSIEAAQQAWAAGTDKLTDSFKDNGATLDLNTEKGRANRDAIKDQVDNLDDYITALVQSGASNEDAAAYGKVFRDELVNQLDQMGLTREEAETYLATLGLTPENIDTAVRLANDEAAKGRVEDLLEAMDDIPAEISTDVQALIAAGQFDEAERRLLYLQSLASRGVTANVGVNPVGYEKSADGRYVNNPMLSLIGEAGDEVVLPLTRPERMKALLADGRVGPRVLAALNGIRRMANGGIVSASVLNSGGSSSADDSKLMANMFETGDLSASDYRAYLADRLAGAEKYSDDWMTIWRSIQQIDEQAAQSSRDRLAEEDAIQRAMLETGAISAEQYEIYLQRRLGSFEQYSADWMAAWRQLVDLQRQEQTDSEQAIRTAFDKAEAQRDLADAERNLADAIAEANEAGGKALLYSLDKKRTVEERQQAEEELVRANERVAAAAFSGAGARAVNAGFAPGTQDWARFVRSEVEAYAETQNPTIAGELRQLLEGVPNFATGGVVKARLGGTLIRAGEAGQDEYILTGRQLQSYRDNAGYRGAADERRMESLAARMASAVGNQGPLIGSLTVGDRRDLPEVKETVASIAWRVRSRG